MGGSYIIQLNNINGGVFMPVDMKNIISSTFISMVKQKGIDKITVKALIDACNISRQTFYYHFQDIMEVIEWSMEQATKNMLSKSLKAGTPEEAISVLISSAVDNRLLVHRLLDSQKRDQIERLFVQAARGYLEELIHSKARKPSINYSDMDVALDFWAFGISGLLFKYCSNESVDADGLAAQICRLLPGKAENSEE